MFSFLPAQPHSSASPHLRSDYLTFQQLLHSLLCHVIVRDNPEQVEAEPFARLYQTFSHHIPTCQSTEGYLDDKLVIAL